MNVGGQGRMLPQSRITGALSTRSTFRRNLTHGPAPTPLAPVGQIGVSPIIRAFPAKVLFANEPSRPNQGVGSVSVQEQEQYAPVNAGQAAAGTMPPAYPLGVQTQPMQPASQALPQLRNLIVQALMRQRPAAFNQVVGGRLT